MAASALPTWCFAVAVVRLGQRFLVVHEQKHGQLWYLPAGRLEPGETFEDAARRETLEEAGIPIDLEGILRIEHMPRPDGTRFRVIFLARPATDTPPKAQPDQHSRGARWVTIEDLSTLPLRGPDVRRLVEDVLAGAPVHPLSILRPEGEPLLPREPAA